MTTRKNTQRVPAKLILGFAGTIFLLACGPKTPKPTVEDPETTPTQVSYDHRLINSQDGRRQFRMETPLLERYELATKPFMEFREGIKIESFTDSLTIENDLVADYAHFDETDELWTAKGNVIGNNYLENRQLLTERLFWDQKAKRIYSDTLAVVIDKGNRHVGWNFEADESFSSWSFHNTVGQIEVDAQRPVADSTAQAAGDSTALATDSIQISGSPAPEVPSTQPSETRVPEMPEPAQD